MSNPVWFVLWCICGIVVGGLEAVALWLPSDGDTLSENLRDRVRRHQWIRWVTLMIWVVFAVWFSWHIWWK